MVYDAVYLSGKFKDFCEEFLNVNLQVISISSQRRRM